MQKNVFFDLALALIVFIFMNILISTSLFIFHCPISILNFTLAFIFSIVTYFFIMKKYKYTWKKIVISIGIYFMIIISCIWCSGKLHDNSYDGNSYHKIAIGELKNGWNPVYEHIADFNNAKVHLLDTNEIWNDHYGKAYWIYAANVYKITNNIESGKSFTLLLMVITFLVSIAFFRNKIEKCYAYILSFLLAINPVILYQMSSYYNDGALGNLLIILIFSLTIMADNKKTISKYQNYLLYFLTLCILINIKFTGFAYAGIYSLFYYLYFIWNRDQRKQNLKMVTITAIASLTVGIGVIGLSTYPKNLLEHGHLFYPLYGKEKIDIMTSNTPTGFHDMLRVKRFLVSNFSVAYNTSNKGEKLYHKKIPFTFKTSELNLFRRRAVDVRVGGYGALFGGILLLSFFSGLYCLYRYKNEKKSFTLYLIPILATIFLILALDESWWARYLPQLYALPIIVVVMLLSVKKTKVSTILYQVISICLITNSYLLVNPVMEGIFYQEKQIKYEFSLIKPKKNETVYVSGQSLHGAIFNVIDAYKNVQIVPTCDGHKNVYYAMDKKVCMYIEKNK